MRTKDSSSTERLYQQILDAVGAMVLVKGESSHILWANKAFLDYYGMSNEQLHDLIDAPFNEPDYTAQYIKDDHYVFTTGNTLAIHAEPVTRHDGVVRYWDTVKSPIRDLDGRIRYTVGVSLDVTDKKRAEEELRRATVVVKEALAAKTNFLAVMSHELRTPLTLILGPLESLLALPDAALSESVRRQLQRMYRSGCRLHRLVSDVLELIRLEAGKAEPSWESVDAASLVGEFVDSAQASAEHAELDLSFLPAGELGPIALDRGMFETIIANLLSNALKFTPRGGHIDVRLLGRGDRLELCVQDSGPGVPAEQQPLLFQRFQQLDCSSTRRQQGSGIGLALVKEFTELMGGHVRVESAVGQGARFFVELPRRAPATPLRAREAPLPGHRRPAPVHETPVELPDVAAATAPRPVVLFVDDSADLRSFVQEVLRPEFEVRLADTGQAALRLLQTLLPDVIITDVMMPELDGMELIARLKADPRLQRIPVIVLTARASRTDLVSGLRAGADDYLAKPFGPEELRARVHTAQRSRELSRQLEQQSAALQAALLRERELREELVQAAKMSAIGTLVSGLAHELNNPLAAILMYAKGLRLRAAQGAQDVPLQALASIERQASRCAELVVQLLSFSHRRPSTRDRVTLGSVLLAIDQLTEAQAQKLQVALAVDPGDAAAALLEVDVASCQTALLNLVANGLQASRPGGSVRISAGYRTRQGRPGVDVRVVDDGVGIAPAAMSRIFDPFYTTKEPGAGTGLGLSLVRSFVESHSGQIEVYSEPGKGTAVSLWLPAASDAAAAEGASS